MMLYKQCKQYMVWIKHKYAYMRLQEAIRDRSTLRNNVSHGALPWIRAHLIGPWLQSGQGGTFLSGGPRCIFLPPQYLNHCCTGPSLPIVDRLQASAISEAMLSALVMLTLLVATLVQSLSV